MVVKFILQIMILGRRQQLLWSFFWLLASLSEARALGEADKTEKPHSSTASTRSYAEFYKSLKATHVEHWDGKLLSRPLPDKIQPLQSLAMDFNASYNKWDGLSIEPKGFELDAATKAELVSQLESLPPSIKNFFNEHIIAIYIATGVGSTAMAGSVYDQKDQCRFGFIILDAGMIDRPANEWITFKERTVFAPVKGYELTVKLEDSDTNTKASTMRYLLLHEIGHVFHAVNKLQPAYTAITWQDEQFQEFAFNDYELFRKRKLGDDYYPLIDRISFYRAKPPFDLDDAKEVYDWLLTTSFSSLYGSTNFLDDFAETFALLVHTKYLKKPFQVTLSRDNSPIVAFGQRFDERPIQAKAMLIEHVLRKYDTAVSGHH